MERRIVYEKKCSRVSNDWSVRKLVNMIEGRRFNCLRKNFVILSYIYYVFYVVVGIHIGSLCFSSIWDFGYGKASTA